MAKHAPRAGVGDAGRSAVVDSGGDRGLGFGHVLATPGNHCVEVAE